MLTALNAEYVIFDVETTGLSPLDGDRIIEIAAVRIKKGVVADHFTSLINPRRPLSQGAQEINRITEDMVGAAPFAEDVLPHMIDFVGGACLVAHNASFDIKFLTYELSLHGRKLREETPVIDTIKMAKSFVPYLASYRLEALANSLGVRVAGTHRALADTQLTATVFQRLLSMAGDYNVHELTDMVAQFGVEKPNFRITQTIQPSLF